MLYATSNRGKMMEVERLFGVYGVEVVSPRDLEIEMEVPETGKTLEENAAIKARAWRERLKSLKGERAEGLIIMADDTGLEIDALGGEPGVKVRRWKDGVTPMSDEEIVAYCLERMQAIPPEARGAQLRIVITLVFPESEEVEYFDGRLRGLILMEPRGEMTKGLPFEILFYVPEWEKVLGDVRRLPDEEKMKYATHREIATEKALERILEWMARDT